MTKQKILPIKITRKYSKEYQRNEDMWRKLREQYGCHAKRKLNFNNISLRR